MNRERLAEIKGIVRFNELSFDIVDELTTALEEAWALSKTRGQQLSQQEETITMLSSSLVAAKDEIERLSGQ